MSLPRLRVVVVLIAAAVASGSCSTSSTGTATAGSSSPRRPPDATTSGADAGSVGSRPPDTALGDAASTAGPAADACSLLTPADIRAATGAAFDNPLAETPQRTQYGAYTACTWLESESPLTTVRVTVWDEATAFTDAREQVGDAVDATGIGERSFTSSLAAVYAVADGHTLFAQYSNFDNDDATNLPISVALAKVAAGNL